MFDLCACCCADWVFCFELNHKVYILISEMLEMEYSDFFFNPYVFMGASCVTDNIGTTLNCAVNGAKMEMNPFVRKRIEEEGVIRGCLYKLPNDFVVGLGGVVVSQGLDYLFGIQDSNINFTNVFAYGAGGVKHICGMLHTLQLVEGFAKLGLEWLLNKSTD